VNPSIATPINLLSEEQAVAELDRLVSSQPDETDFLKLIKWEQENRQRIQQLQSHILHLQRLAAHGEEAAPAPEPEPQPVKEKYVPTPPLNTKPADVKLATSLAYYQGILSRAQVRPSDRDLRNNCLKAASAVRACAKKLGLPVPEMGPLPEIPDPKRGGDQTHRNARITAERQGDIPAAPAPPVPTARQREILDENEFKLGIISELQDVAEPGLESPALEKAGPGPYMQPTSADILAELAQRQHHHVEEPAQADVYAHHMMPEASTADLDFHDRNRRVPIAPDPTALHAAIRRLRQDTCRLLVLMEEADPQDRADHHGSLQVLYAYVGQALELVGEAAIPEAS